MNIILASNNQHKLAEIRKILLPAGYNVISLADAGIDTDIEETGATFEENALIKAKAVYDLTHQPVIADDSGLEVDALGGRPGVFSHRYAGEDADDEERCSKLLSELDGVEPDKRTARFVCVICYIDQNASAVTVRGTCEGTIGMEPQGSNGFGYDPVFMYSGKSFAQLSQEEKNSVSHRADALRKFSEIITEEKK